MTLRQKYIQAFAFIVVIFLGNSAWAQNNPYKINDKLFRYYDRCYHAVESNRVLAMADTLFAMAGKMHDSKAQCLAMYVKCDYYYYKNDIKGMINAKAKLEAFAKNTPHKQYIFGAWNHIVDYYYNHHKNIEAINEMNKYHEAALKYNNEYGIAHSYSKMGDIYSAQKKYKLAIEQFKHCGDIYLKSNSPEMFRVYDSMGQAYAGLDEFDKSEEYYKKALETVRVHKLTPQYSTLINIHLFRLYVDQRRKGEATILKNILELQRKNHEIRGFNKVAYLGVLADYYLIMGDYAQAYHYADSIGVSSDKALLKSNYYEKTGDYHRAFNSLKDYFLLRDSIAQLSSANIQDYYSVLFRTKDIELQKNNLLLQNTAMKLKAIKEEEREIMMQKAISDLKLKQQRTDIELMRERDLKQKSAIKLKEHELKQMRQDAEYKKHISNIFTAIFIGVGILSLIYIIVLLRNSAKLRIRTKEAEESRRIALNANALKTAFLQNISHEIRTPLNAVVGFNDLINAPDNELTDDDKASMLEQIHTNTDLLLRLMNEIIEMSKLETGNYKLTNKEIKVFDLCRTAMNYSLPDARDSVSTILDTQETDLTIVTDAKYLNMVLTHLLSNAYKYTTQGTVTLSYRSDGNHVVIAVTDTGVGIPASETERIFRQFEKLDTFKSGFGLGLSICQKIITILQGKIVLDTKYTSGARFFISLPKNP